MDINRFEEFIVLADCLNYSKAANLLYLTQPVLSRHITDLENLLGAKLFIRDTHKVALTPIGELAVHEISHAMDAYHKAMRNIKLATGNLNGRLAVGFLGEAVRPFFTQFIKHLDGKPRLQVDYTSVSELDSLIRYVDAGAMDLGFVTHVETSRLQGMGMKWIVNDPLCVAMAPGDALADRESVSIRELLGKPIITYDRDTDSHTAAFQEKLFQRFGAEMNVVRKVRNIESGLFYVNLGIGYLIIPRHLTHLARDLTVVPVSDEGAYVSLYLIWKKTNSKPAVQNFVKEFSAFFNKQYPM